MSTAARTGYASIPWRRLAAVIDWSIPDDAIAHNAGATTAVVRAARKRYAARSKAELAVHVALGASRQTTPAQWRLPWDRVGALVDWSINPAAIALATGAGIDEVLEAKAKHGQSRPKDPPQAQRPRRVDGRLGSFAAGLANRQRAWHAIDWRLSDEQIAGLTGTTKGLVQKRRSELADADLRRPVRTAKDLMWTAIDWRNAPDPTIAAALGIDEQTVAKNRRAFAPETTNSAERDRSWEAVDWNRPTCVIARQMKASIQNVSARRARHAPHTVGRANGGRRYDWSGVDWSLDNMEIARRVGCAYVTVAMRRSARHPETMRRHRTKREEAR